MPTDWRDLPAIEAEEHDAAIERLREERMPSQTFLKHYDRCKRAAFLYEKHRGGPGSHPLDRGSIFHYCVENLTREIIMLGAGELSDVDKARALAMAREEADTEAEAKRLAAEWIREQEEGRTPVERAKQELNLVLAEHPELTVPAYERDQLRIMLRHWALATPFRKPAETIVGVEQMLMLKIETPGGTWIVRGKLDLIESPMRGLLDITDYKTSFAMPDAEAWHRGGLDFEGRPLWGGNVQTQIYALLAKFGTTPEGLRLGDGIEKIRVFLRFPRYLFDDGELGYKDAEIYPVQLADFRDDLVQLLSSLEASIATRKWQPTPGSHCGECPASYECPLPRHLRPDSQGAEIDSIEDAERYAASWLFMQRRATALKSALKKAAERLGVEEIYAGSDIGLKFIPTDSEGLKPKALARVREGIEGAVEYGHPFELGDFVQRKQGTSWDKRKLPKREDFGATEGNSEDGSDSN